MSVLKRFGCCKVGRYETRVIALSTFVSLFCSFPPLQSLVTQYSPPHRCDVSKAVNLTNFNATERKLLFNWTVPRIESTSGKISRSSCKLYNISGLHTNMDIEELFSNKTELELIPCDSFHYDAEETSAVTEFGMVCEKSRQAPLFISLLMSGMCVGGMTAGIFSDKFGRKPTLLGCFVIRYTVSMLTSFSTNLAMYGIMVFLTGMTSLVDYITIFVLVNEVSPPRFRPSVVCMMEASYNVGALFVALLAYLIPHWRWYLRITGLFGMLFVPYYWLIDESPSWLVATGKYKRAEVLLKKIARINKCHAKSIEEVTDTLTEDQKSASSFRESAKSFLKQPILFNRLMIMAFAWFVACMVFYAVIFSSNNLSGNRYVNIVLQGLTGLIVPPVYFAMAYILGHRKLYMFFTAGTVLALVVIPFIVIGHPFVATAMSFLVKILMGVGFVVIYAIIPELFPTTSRQMVFGVCNFSARVGGIISPFVVTVGNSGSNYSTALGTAGAALVSVLLFGFLPETKQKELPQSTEDALRLNSGWRLPFKRSKPSKVTLIDHNHQKKNVL